MKTLTAAAALFASATICARAPTPERRIVTPAKPTLEVTTGSYFVLVFNAADGSQHIVATGLSKQAAEAQAAALNRGFGPASLMGAIARLP